ncbi:uncharacterized protein ARMOST_17552 [Armillaria ostoyae]|uniref:Uncharacterized protein n=1 Tax=Armillaria ostoyae TaxID=47428 RepID=A0A284RZD1_ARMOS|nr:uncharacterized protein ARMOST_17552 [Armillaria ostoyae]
MGINRLLALVPEAKHGIKVGTVVYILMRLQGSAKRNTIGSTPRVYILEMN